MRLRGTKTSTVSSSQGLGDQLYDLGGARPTLDLNFANNDSLADSITGKTLPTFTRASSGTYVDGDGLIKTTPVNLLTYSEEFDNAAWTVQGTPTLTASSQLAPDGSLTAWDITRPDGAGHFIRQAVTGLNTSATYTYSLYVKVASGTADFQLLAYDTAARFSSVFTATTEWQRFDFTIQPTATTTNFYLADPEPSAFGTALTVWGAQLQEGTTATDYIPTTSTISGAPRFDHDPVTGESLGLLIEESRTNLMLNSGTTAEMVATNQTTRTSGGFAAPDGSTDASRVDVPLVDGPNQTQIVTEQFGSLATSTSYTSSVYLKGVNGGELVYLTFGQGVPTSFVAASLTTEWQRFDITGSTTTSLLFFNVGVDTRSGTGQANQPAQSFYIWGAQVEQGSFPTSYIPTTSSTVTRAADVAEITGADFAKTNLLEYSERLDQGTSGTDASIYVVPDATIAPDGTKTADLLVTSLALDGVFRDVQTTNTETYTFSCFAKPTDGNSDGTIRLGVSGNYVENVFNLASQTFTLNQNGTSTVISGGIQSASNGWYRVYVVGSSVGTTSGSRVVFYDNLYFWGAQLEEGSVLTEYTPSVESFDSRASSATYVDDETGLIKTTPVNLLLRSETVDQWLMATGATVTADATTAPDGTLTADRVQLPAGENVYTFTSGSPLKPNTTYTTSIYVKDNGTDLYLQELDDNGFGGLRYQTRFTFSTKTFILQGSGSANMATPIYEEVGDGWFRIIQTITVQSNPSNLIFMNRYSVQDNFLWGAQLEEGSTASPYIRTTSTISGAARYENGELILEEARTNIIDNNTSNYNSIWSNATPPGAYNNAGIAPDGTNTAFATTSYDGVGRGQKNYTTAADTNDYTFSIFIKSTGGQGQYISFLTGFNGGDQDASDQVVYDFATDTVGHGYSRKLYANGWVRVWKTYTNSNLTAFLTTNRNTTSLDLLFWGAQLEQGSYPSSLIITPDGGDVTRAADVSTSALGVDSFYNQDAGTVFVDVGATNQSPTSAGRPFMFHDGTADNRIGCNFAFTSTFNLFYSQGGNSPVDLGSIPGLPKDTTAAIAYTSGDYRGVYDGNLALSDSTAAVPVVNVLSLGFQGYNSVAYHNGHIKRLAYFPVRLPDATLQNITS